MMRQPYFLQQPHLHTVLLFVLFHFRVPTIALLRPTSTILDLVSRDIRKFMSFVNPFEQGVPRELMKLINVDKFMCMTAGGQVLEGLGVDIGADVVSTLMK